MAILNTNTTATYCSINPHTFELTMRINSLNVESIHLINNALKNDINAFFINDLNIGFSKYNDEYNLTFMYLDNDRSRVYMGEAIPHKDTLDLLLNKILNNEMDFKYIYSFKALSK